MNKRAGSRSPFAAASNTRAASSTLICEPRLHEPTGQCCAASEKGGEGLVGQLSELASVENERANPRIDRELVCT